MATTESEYRKALEQLEQDADYIHHQRKHLENIDIVSEQLERTMQPTLSFHEQLKEEVNSLNSSGS
jgi:hypothetical protein